MGGFFTERGVTCYDNSRIPVVVDRNNAMRPYRDAILSRRRMVLDHIAYSVARIMNFATEVGENEVETLETRVREFVDEKILARDVALVDKHMRRMHWEDPDRHVHWLTEQGLAMDSSLPTLSLHKSYVASVSNNMRSKLAIFYQWITFYLTPLPLMSQIGRDLYTRPRAKHNVVLAYQMNPHYQMSWTVFKNSHVQKFAACELRMLRPVFRSEEAANLQ